MLACSDTSLQNRETWKSKRKIFSAFSTHRKSQLPALIEVSRFKLWNQCFCLNSVVTNNATLIHPAAVHSVHALTWFVMTGHLFLTFAAHDRNMPAGDVGTLHCWPYFSRWEAVPLSSLSGWLCGCLVHWKVCCAVCWLVLRFEVLTGVHVVESRCSWITGTDKTTINTGVHFQFGISIWFQKLNGIPVIKM